MINMGLFDRLGEQGSVLQSKRKMHLFYFTYFNQILNSKGASKNMLFGGLGSLNQKKSLGQMQPKIRLAQGFPFLSCQLFYKKSPSKEGLFFGISLA